MLRNARTITIALIAGMLFAASLFLAAPGGLRHLSQTSAVAAPPATATYVSELGPSSVQPPRHAVTLPASGAGAGLAGLPWPKFAGLALAIGGALLIHGALTMRPRRAAHS